MKHLLSAVVILWVADPAAGADITLSLRQVADDATTNPLVFDGAYDVYQITAENPNAADATSLELSLNAAAFGGAFIQAASGSEIVKGGAELGDLLGFENPDTFFVVPVGPDILLAPGTGVDTANRLAGSYTVAGDTALIPSGGSAVIATITVPGATPTLGVTPGWALTGRASAGGEFVSVTFYPPEPSSATLGLIAAVGIATGLHWRG